MQNIPVLIAHDGTRSLYVFEDFMGAGVCTGRTAAGRRCRNETWEEGQVATYEDIYVNDLVVSCYGPLSDDVGRRYLTQRCRVHDSPDAVAFCDPEWERFDPARHHEMTRKPSYNSLFMLGAEPPPRIVALALHEHCGEAERRLLASLLVEGPARS